MENSACNVIYVDRRVCEDRLVHSTEYQADRTHVKETGLLGENIGILLNVFTDVHLCSTGAACLSKLLEIQDSLVVDLKPTLVLIDTERDDTTAESPSRSRSPSPHSKALDLEDNQSGERELYGLSLLRRLVSETYMRNISRLVVLVPVVVPVPEAAPAVEVCGDTGEVLEMVPTGMLLECAAPPRRAANRRYLKRCLDLGATDIMSSPMNAQCVVNLEVHCYRAHRDVALDNKALLAVRTGRKRSWVGLTEEKPFAYLRESMVSNLMKRICQLDEDRDDRLASVKIYVPGDRRAKVAEAVGRWHFDAHEFSEDELVIAASVMFRHALAMPELEQWRMPTDRLETFIIACRAAYNEFVPYHNFRHVIDVMQATFSFLVNLGALPQYPAPADASRKVQVEQSPVAALLGPFEALTLLITAIGHDVGHPGVNNGFLIKLNAPLAQLYNDRSVLEAFHCAAYSQILRRHWPSAFDSLEMRNLMISSILATDMGLHFDYMKKMSDLQIKLQDLNSTSGWNNRMMEEQKALACSLLIKCADISNVAREYSAALKWMNILSDEFSRQAAMENEVDIPTSLMGQQKRDIISLSKAQLGFMNMFAIPLFQGVADLIPTLRYTVDELAHNKGRFDSVVADAASQQAGAESHGRKETEGHPGPTPPGQSPAAGLPGRLVSWPAQRLDVARTSTERGFEPKATSPVKTPPRLPDLTGDYREINENGTRPGEHATPSSAHSTTDGAYGRQGHMRSSEATDGTNSVPTSGDWVSQATSATTGRMPLSPSTQGTSIVSRDSLERPMTTITAVDSLHEQSSEQTSKRESPQQGSEHIQQTPSNQSVQGDLGTSTSHSDVTGSPKSDDKSGLDKAIKKKPSRFRINALSFLRKHKSPSPPLPAADMTG